MLKVFSFPAHYRYMYERENILKTTVYKECEEGYILYTYNM